MIKRLIALILLMAVIPLSALADDYPSYYGQHGTAKFIGGTTVIVSIFANDKNTSWNFPLAGAEKKLYNKIHKRMGIGMAWLEKQTKRYKVKSRFIWDFDKYGGAGGLCYTASFSEDLINGGWDSYLAVADYIHQNIDSAGLLKQYEADNIAYAVHLNAPDSDDYRSFVRCANSTDVPADKVYYEVIFYVPYGHHRENTPAVYAHELLHCFGAADLYYANDFVPQAYVDYLTKKRVRDLMNSCYYSAYNKVTCKFSDVDAYLVGLLDTCKDAEKYGLGPNIFQRWK